MIHNPSILHWRLSVGMCWHTPGRLHQEHRIGQPARWSTMAEDAMVRWSKTAWRPRNTCTMYTITGELIWLQLKSSDVGSRESSTCANLSYLAVSRSVLRCFILLSLGTEAEKHVRPVVYMWTCISFICFLVFCALPMRCMIHSICEASTTGTHWRKAKKASQRTHDRIRIVLDSCRIRTPYRRSNLSPMSRCSAKLLDPTCPTAPSP